MAFETEEIALAFIRALRVLIGQIAKHDRDLADQLKRAANGAALQPSEARRREGRDCAHLYRVANGSASEARTALRVAVAWGYLEARETAAAEQLADRLVAITWRLAHPRPSR
jgi:four helix bundle protein